MGSIVRCSFPVTEGAARHACIVAIKDNKMGAILHEQIPSTSCHRSYCITPSLHELIHQMHAGQRSMCGLIVVDAGRSRSTNLVHDTYILIIALDIVITIRFSIKCPTLICLPTMCYFLREATSEIYGPRVYSLSYFLLDLFLFAFVFRSIISKPQKYFVALFICIFYFAFYRDLFIQSTRNFIRST